MPCAQQAPSSVKSWWVTSLVFCTGICHLNSVVVLYMLTDVGVDTEDIQSLSHIRYKHQ